MRETHRCLSPQGWLLSQTLSTDRRGAFQDPTHVSFWNSNSFWYYTLAGDGELKAALPIGLRILYELLVLIDVARRNINRVDDRKLGSYLCSWVARLHGDSFELINGTSAFG